MFKRSYKTLAVAMVSAAALTAATLPASARSAAYCRVNVPHETHHSGLNPIVLLPLAAVGAGAGALVGAAVGGLSVGTGAAIGAGSGAGFGILHGITYHGDKYDNYADAYEACRSE